MNLPERFGIEYVDEGGQRKRPVMLHRALFGSLERFTGILLEHHYGKLPAWLSPVQVVVCSISQQHADYARDVANFFGTTDWSTVETIAHPGEAGTASWRTCHFGGIRVRMVEYTPGYLADHWCHKGHILLCMEGELDTELDDGRTFTLRPGMSYQVADNAEAHRSSTLVGAKLFIVD